MKLTPIGDRVVVRPAEPEQKTAGGIVLPDSAQERPQQGRVLAVGDGRLLENGLRSAPQIAEGDRVVFLPYSGNEIEVAGEKLLLLREADILAVLE
ncbi:MAG: co-chaperone GroES [Pirellulales bacterium]